MRIKVIKQLSSEAVVGAYCARIGAVEPQLGAVVEERMAEALDEARRVDRLVRQCAPDQRGAPLLARKPLLGVPFTAKDLLAVKGGQPLSVQFPRCPRVHLREVSREKELIVTLCSFQSKEGAQMARDHP
ncbi:hypothetical protein HPB48_015734 [Haemaphysalis longicornis]|uniref:Amidase domain-containing protein n=1 Tax=Haemaphysalis longicornis TaxID=44386 RepID=A0A9J6H5L0_HAELO|nr:hypothetical protein HPB48_015734 [Haemaphysalis longicornis]